MNEKKYNIFGRLVAPGKSLFLLDASGALLSAFSLGVVLRQFQPYFGMPSNVLVVLTLLACAFACYSWSCYFLVKDKWPTFLRVIMILNVLYGCLSLVLLQRHFAELTMLGVTYFVLELIVLAGVVFIEFSAIRKFAPSR